MNKKLISYIGIILIGIGFVMMALGNVLGNEIATVSQAVCGVLFIIVGTAKCVSETKKEKE